MKKFSFNSFIRKQQTNGVFTEAIWKSWHRHLRISIVIGIGIAKNYFCYQNLFFLKKVEYLCSSLCLVMVSVPPCYKYLVLYDFLFIQSNCVHWCSRKKAIWTFGSTHPGVLKKTTAPKISACFPAKHPELSSF